MVALRLVALTCCIGASTLLAAAPPARPVGSAEVLRLIDQLGDRDFRVRTQAERQLAAEGLAALPALRKALGHPDPEVRRRVLRMVPGLEHAALVSPRRVTLTIQNQPIRTVLEEISKASGYKIQHMGVMVGPQGGFGGGMVMVAPAIAGPAGKAPAAPKEPTFSYSFVNEPFWDVIDQVCRDGGLVLQQGYGDEIVRLFQGRGHSPHVGRDGAFRYAASNLQLYRNIDLSNHNAGSGAPPRQETLTLNVTLFAEPRLPFLGLGEPRVDAAYDSEKNSLLVPVNVVDGNENAPFAGGRIGRRYYNGGYKQMSLQASLALQRISEKATSIKLIRGVLPVTVLVEQKPIDLSTDILNAKGKKMTVGDLEFNIESVQKMPNNQFQVKFSVTNKGNPNDYTWQNTLYQRLELLDEKGTKFQNWGSNWHGGGNNTVTLTLTYSGTFGGVKPGDPKRFVYHHWVTRQHDIHFELRDVPLP
ncbi:MAG: hypothetical protein U0840_21830 [Gemmataceae bacterium]